MVKRGPHLRPPLVDTPRRGLVLTDRSGRGNARTRCAAFARSAARAPRAATRPRYQVTRRIRGGFSFDHLVGAAGYLYAFAPLGRRTVKTEPLPGSLVTVTSPPIRRASLRVMARPSPVPPK